MTMDNLIWLQDFYSRLCDGDWEHAYGLNIGNLDNPGWRIDFDVADTRLEAVAFTPIKFERTEVDWVHCWVRDRKFVGRGGPHNLDELIRLFREWVEAHIGPDESPWLGAK